jgi:glyoxylase-like metal-dependent hydrolase (beta-lactamase superfamily II)
MFNRPIVTFLILLLCPSAAVGLPGFEPTGEFSQISDNLYRYADCSVVYLVKDGNRGLLVDYGSGGILDHLDKAAVRSIDRVLVTHHHRDQVQGLLNRTDPALQVMAPAAELRFLENVQQFWDSAHIYLMYNLQSHFFTIPKSIEINRGLQDGDTVEWGPYTFQVIATPGHTRGSISYLAKIDGKNVAFSGDMISAPGKVTNYATLHWGYMPPAAGIGPLIESLDKIKAASPNLLLPSHGQPMESPETAIEQLKANLGKCRDITTPNHAGKDYTLRQISPHVYYVGGTTYAIVSEAGNALLWDVGYVDRDRMAEFVKMAGGKKFDIITFSHYHDDHIIRATEFANRPPWMPSRARPEIWVHRSMADILVHPNRYHMPCTIPFPIRPDRIIEDEEIIEWEEFKLHFFHQPGQTDFAAGLFVEADGVRYVFCGDNFWAPEHPEAGFNGPLIPRNEYFLDGGFIKTTKKLIELNPNVIAPAHTDPFDVTPADLQKLLGWVEAMHAAVAEVIDAPDPMYGLDSRWAHFYPYHVELSGGPFRVEVRIRNHLDKPIDARVNLVLPDGIETEGGKRERTTIEAKSSAALAFQLAPSPYSGGPRRRLITADIQLDDHYFGQVAEMVAEYPLPVPRHEK